MSAEMNRCAARLGMEHSRFANPSGLNAEGHCSTARDLALLARACLKNETLAAIAATRSVTLEGRSFVNHNKLLWRYEGCVGLKTGYTEKAGRTLVSAAEREGMTLIAVTLDDPDDWRDHAALFDWGLLPTGGWRRRSGRGGGLLPAGGGSLVPFCPVRAGRTCAGPCGRGSGWSFGRICPWSSSPLRCRRECGSGTLYGAVGDEEAGKVPLVCGEAVPRDLAEPQRGLSPEAAEPSGRALNEKEAA
ncbi:MAG: D-alanyl-D-alanine carboxypeptidase family protein [Lawsonibacter sp.]